ncbi:response regulator [bacterium]|nr:response regulator [bacterium]
MKRILLVDDTPGWVRFHRNNIEYLNMPDIEIDEAFSAKEALSKIETAIDNPYDVIFTDLQMESDFLPYLAGEWLVKQIKTYDKYYKNTKIVIVSASPNIELIAKRNEVLYIPKTVIRNAEAEIYLKFIE